MKKRILSLALAVMLVVLAIPAVTLPAAAAGTESKWTGGSAVTADTLLDRNSELIRFFQWYKGGSQTPMAVGDALDSSCVAKINPALIAEGIIAAEDTLSVAYDKFCAYLKRMNAVTPTDEAWSYGNVKSNGVFTEFRYYAHYHNCNLLLADSKVAGGDMNGYCAPEADWDKMMRDLLSGLVSAGILKDSATGSAVTAVSASVAVKNLSVAYSSAVSSLRKYTNLTDGTTALGFIGGRAFAGYGSNDQVGYTYTAPREGELLLTLNSIDTDGSYKWKLIVKGEFQQSDWCTAGEDSVAEINAAFAALGSMPVAEGDTVTLVLERDSGKHFTPTITANLLAKNKISFLDKNGNLLTSFTAEEGAAMPTPPYAAGAEGWIVNGAASATLPTTVEGDMVIQYAGDFAISDVSVQAASVTVSSAFAINLYLQADPHATSVGVADDYGKTYVGVKQADGTYKVTLSGISAKDMSKTLSLCLYQSFVDGGSYDAPELYTLTPTALLAEYEESTVSAKEKAIAAAALDYAAAADAYFNGTALSADVKARLAAQDAAIAALESNVTRTDAGEYVVDAVTLVLRDQVALKIRVMSSMYMPLGEDTLSFAATVEAGGTERQYSGFVYTDGDNGYSITVTLGGIAPADFDLAQRITVKDGTSLPVSATFSYCVNDYIARIFDASAKEADLLRAIYALGAAANA